ncbi:MAG: YegP family protein [Bacteroidota bacterium]
MFEIFQSEKSGEFYFRLKAKNGQKILGSEGYTTKSACMNGVESVKKNAGEDGRYERKEAKNGKHHFNLKAGNGQVIGSSQMYESASGMENGIESVKKNADGAEVKDLTA